MAQIYIAQLQNTAYTRGWYGDPNPFRGFTLAETPLEPDYVYLMHVVNETIYLKQNCSIATTPSFFYVSARATMATYNKCIQTYFSFIQHKSPITKYELEVAFD